MRKVGAFLIGVLTAGILVAAAACLSFSVLLTPYPTHIFSKYFADGSVSGLSQDEMAQVADGILDYSLGNDDADLPVGTDYKTSITQDDLAHLRDCRALFLGVQKAGIAFGVVGLALIIFLAASHRKRLLGRSMMAAGIVIVVIMGVAAYYAIDNFYAFFSYLHSFFFTNGNWLFPDNCLMICALPLTFWMAMGVLWVVLIVIFCLVYITAGRHFVRRGR